MLATAKPLREQIRFKQCLGNDLKTPIETATSRKKLDSRSS